MEQMEQMEKSIAGVKITWFIIGAVVAALVAWIIVASTSPAQVAGQATSPGTGGGITNATGLASDCIVDLYGGAAQVPKKGASKVSVDDTVSQCVKARGGQIVTGGTCDADSADGCSNTFSFDGQDPDSDQIFAIFDVLNDTGLVIGDMFVTAGGQVLGLGAGCVPESQCDLLGQLCLAGECSVNGVCTPICTGGGGPPIELVRCAQEKVNNCIAKFGTGCSAGACIQASIVTDCVGLFVQARECSIVVQ